MTATPLYVTKFCRLFPTMTDAELDDLRGDMAVHGQHVPILVLQDGGIIDGGARFAACQSLGMEPKTELYTGSLDDAAIAAFVMSLNFHRRHLSIQQRAAIAAEIATMTRGENQYAKEGPPFGIPSKKSTAEAARAMGVSSRSVERAKKVMREDPKAHAAVKAGTVVRKVRAPRHTSDGAQLEKMREYMRQWMAANPEKARECAARLQEIKEFTAFFARLSPVGRFSAMKIGWANLNDDQRENFLAEVTPPPTRAAVMTAH